MTAIYAFIENDQRNSVIWADNIKCGSTLKVDKIHLLQRRYAIAVCGNNTPEVVIGHYPQFEHNKNYNPPPNLNNLLEDIMASVKKAASHLYPQYKKAYEQGDIPEITWELCLFEKSTLVILDFIEQSLYSVNLGNPFPPEKLIDKPTLSPPLENGKLHTFAMAKKVDSLRPKNLLKPNFQDILGYANKVLEIDRKNLLPSNPEVYQEVGLLGALATSQAGEISYFSAFKNPAELIDEAFGDILGYQINITN